MGDRATRGREKRQRGIQVTWATNIYLGCTTKSEGIGNLYQVQKGINQVDRNYSLTIDTSFHNLLGHTTILLPCTIYIFWKTLHSFQQECGNGWVQALSSTAKALDYLCSLLIAQACWCFPTLCVILIHIPYKFPSRKQFFLSINRLLHLHLGHHPKDSRHHL